MIFDRQTFDHKITFLIELPIRQFIFFWKIFPARIYIILVFLTGITPSTFAQQAKIDSLYNILSTSKSDTNKVKTLYFLTQALNGIKPDKGLIYAKQGLSLAQKLSYKKGESICLNAIGLTYLQMGKLDSAMISYERRYEIVKELKDSIGIAGVYDNMSVINIHLGNMDKALELRLKANKIYSHYNKKKMLASGYTWIGNIYKEQGQYSSALEYYFKTLKIYDDDNRSQDIGYPLINISSIYRYLKQYDQAKNYALEAKTVFEKSKNAKGVGVSLYRLAIIYFEEKDYDNSIKHLNEAKKIFEDTQDTYFVTLVNQLLGTIAKDKGDNEIALDYFNHALDKAQNVGDVALISTIFQNIGTVYSAKGDYIKALEYMHKSEKILNEIKDKKSLLELSPNFVELYSRINQTDSVMKYMQIYQQLSDTIFNEQTTKSIAEMQTKYETEKKDNEILVLHFEAEKREKRIWMVSSGFGFLFVFSVSGFVIYRNKKKKEQAILNQKTAELSREVSESNMKALRSQMNPHFIFNCVHTIERLLSEAKINESKICLERFSNLTRSVLENSIKREITLDEELETLQLYMELENFRFKNPFTYSITIESGIDVNTTLVPPLILQPFVENSIKHGFRDLEKTGHLKIEVKADNELLICTVEDNGIGRMESKSILSGFKKESIGMKLTESRLNLISEMKNTKSYFLIDDLVDATNKPLGTHIKMFLPYELSI